MKVDELLSNSLEFCNKYEFTCKELEVNIEDLSLVERILDEVIDIQYRGINEVGPDWCMDFSRLIIDDIVRNKNAFKHSDGLIVLNYFQFSVSILPLYHFSNIKNLQRAYDWVTYSLCDDFSESQQKEIETFRLYEFIPHPIVGMIFDYPRVKIWISRFFYISRCMSTFHGLANYLIDWSIKVCFKVQKGEDPKVFSEALANMACWSAANQHESIGYLVKTLEDGVCNKVCPKTIKADFLVCLSTNVGSFSSKNSWEWAKVAISDYDDQFSAHQKLQLLLDSVHWGEDDLDQSKELILGEVKKITDENILFSKSDHLAFLKLTDRLVGLITPFIGSCIKYGEEGFAYHLLRKWYTVKSERSIDIKKQLLIYPNHESSVSFIVAGEGVVLECCQSNYLENMMTMMNVFLGVSNSVVMLPTFELHQPKHGRLGIPSEDVSGFFESALYDFYHLDFIKEELSRLKCNIDSFLVLPGYNHPLQYLMKKYLFKAWPYSASLEKPYADRVVKKICLWCGAGSYTEAMEVDAIKSVFSDTNIVIDYYPSDTTTLDAFKDIYQSDKYDVIWVMSHGEYDHWEVGDVKIAIGGDDFLNLKDALDLKVPLNASRRLLFLNVCDGATHAHLGGIPKLGFAPALSSPSQCVISHLWPVNPYVAAMFGVLLSLKLRDGSQFFNAYAKSLSHLLKSNDEIISLLKQFEELSNIMDRIVNQGIDCSLLAHAGSSAFFE